MNSLIDTIDKIQSISYRDIPVSNLNNIDPSLYKSNQRQLGINSPNRLTSFHSVSLGLIYNAGNRLTMNGANYGYDNTNQLTSVTGAQTHNYQFDAVGNRQIADGTTYSANSLNQYSSVGAQAYTYDGNGNLTNDGTNTYVYDVENRLTSAICPLTSATYTYDGFGRRIAKTVDGTKTYFIYDGDQIIEERDSSGSLLASYVYGDGIDEVLTMNRASQNYYYFYDGLGSVTDITNSKGEVAESYSYDVYGAPSQLSAIGNRYYFTGREFDSETELYYFRARYYSPAIGRFLQRDLFTWAFDDVRLLFQYNDTLKSIIGKIIIRIGQNKPAVYNLYTYAYDSPLNWLDPYGLGSRRQRPLESWPFQWWLAHHDQFFFDDGKEPANSGFFNTNDIRPDRAPQRYQEQYRIVRDNMDDALLRQAIAIVSKTWDMQFRLFGNQCQDFADTVEGVYDLLKAHKR